MTDAEIIGLVEDGATTKVLAALKEDPSQINVKTEWGATLLHRAAVFGHKQMMRLLLDQGLPASVRDSYGATPLHSVPMHLENSPQAAELLLNAGCPLDARDKYGNTPLMVAAQHSNVPLARYLISKGANLALRNRRKMSIRDQVAYQAESLHPKRQRGQIRALRELESLLADHGSP